MIVIIIIIIANKSLVNNDYEYNTEPSDGEAPVLEIC